MKRLLFLITATMTFATSSFAQLGSLSTDLVYTPVTPCRVLDTRPSQGGTGPITADGTKHFKIWGQGNFAPQGGSPTSNCGLSAGANIAAVAMNFTVVTPAAGGYITAFPFGAVKPVAATVNFQVGDIARGDFSIAKVTQTGTAATNHLSIFSTSLADVVGDVVGYYSAPVSAGSLQCEVLVSAPFTIAAGVRSNGYTPTCSAGWTAMTGGIYSSTNENQTLNSLSPLNDVSAGEQIFYSLTNTGAITKTYTLRTKCCRIPGR